MWNKIRLILLVFQCFSFYIRFSPLEIVLNTHRVYILSVRLRMVLALQEKHFYKNCDTFYDLQQNYPMRFETHHLSPT